MTNNLAPSAIHEPTNGTNKRTAIVKNSSFESVKKGNIDVDCNYIDFNDLSTSEVFNIITKENSEKIEDMGQMMALKLLRKASRDLPAYRSILSKNNIFARSMKEFNRLPIITKTNYLKKYNLKELYWRDDFQELCFISVSSGTTGEPFYWPRGLSLEYETTLEYEIILKYIFEADKKKTLFIIGYAMGMYVAGVFTLNSLLNLKKKGYPLTIASPGSDKNAIIHIVKNLGHYFDQIIIAAYPPVLKDVVDMGVEENIVWSKYNIKLISGGEGFSEEFRDYIYKKINNKNYLKGLINTYGSADAAILGHETPLSILIRKKSAENIELCKALFGDNRVPSLQQYYPFYKYFEAIDGNLVFSTYGGIPLIRYAIGDVGGIISYKQMIQILDQFKIDVKSEMTKYGCDHIITRLPFVYLFSRKDNTRIFYGANIYPEHIKSCLEQEAVVEKVTGRFYIDIILDRKYNQSLYLAIEMIGGVKANNRLKYLIGSAIHQRLLIVNDEYRYLSQTIGSRIYPTIELYAYHDPKYFSPSIKPRYVKKP